MTTIADTFGCNDCWPPAADHAWERLQSMESVAELVDDSHFMVKLRSCRKCRQHFVSVFTETIDWADGEDPQFWCVMPTLPVESQQLLDAGDKPVSTLRALAPDRRSLCHDFPKNGHPTSYWGNGVVIRPHD